MHQKQIISAGKSLSEADKALILIHGREGNAQNIMGLSQQLNVANYALFAPQATNNTWYPLSFLAPIRQNEPWLSSAISILSDLVAEINQAGIHSSNIYFVGFSQGACLTLEFVTRHARSWGGVVAFTGGLIGDQLDTENYKGDFAGTQIFIGTSDPDLHVPVERVKATTKLLQSLNANVIEKIYPNMGHTIIQDEIDQVNELIFK
ncbi:MAG: dienelactone hydrolase family protein [Saprospiraceae bacterium]|nr:dienelactone hydrolase family protein [Saprospiraceae bacterium]